MEFLLRRRYFDLIKAAMRFFMSIMGLGLIPLSALAGSGITYAGRIFDVHGVPVISNSVRFSVTLYDALGQCWLYTEQRQLDLSQTSGSFSFDIGSNDATLLPLTASFNNQISPTGVKNMSDVFNNIKSFNGLGTDNGCSGTFTPNPSDLTAGRTLAVFFSVNGGPQQALPMLKLNPVPAALTVGGYGTGELLKISESVNPALNSNPNNALSQTQYDEFWRLIKNPLSAYLPTSGEVSIVSGSNKVTSLLGQALPAGPATNNQVLVSNGTSWTLQTMGSGSVTSVTANAPLSAGGTASAPVLSIPAATTSADGYLTSTDWNTFNTKQTNSLASGSVWVGNGSGQAQARTLSGDATIDNTGALTLASTITAGTAKGTAQTVPQISYDAKGRLTAVTEVTINDNTKLPLAGGTMTGAIAMGGQNLTNTGDITMAANKYLSLSANSTDGTAAGQMWYDSGTIKYFDGSTVKSLGVAGVGITSLNGLTAGTQTFAIGTSGTAPGFNSATSTHTLNIPMASTAGVTAGLLSKTDYDRLGDAETLNAKAFDTTAASSMGQILYFDSAADKWKVSAASAPTDGQVLKWNDTNKNWEPGTDTGGWTAVDASYAAKGIVQFDTNATTSGVNVSSGVASVVRTTTAESNKILSLDGTGTANMYAAGIKGATSGAISLQAPSTTANYSLTLPAAQGGANQVLSNNGSGVLSWVTPLTAVSNSASLTSGSVWVGNASNVATATDPSGLFIMKGGQAGATSLGTTNATSLSFLTNNSTQMTIDSSGRVGIGTTNPQSLLHVSGSTDGAIEAMQLQNTSDGINAHSIFRLYNDLGGTGAGFFMNSSTRAFDGGSSAFTIYNDLGPVRFRTNPGSIQFLTGTPATEKMTILNGGNVGVGTLLPDTTLHVYSTQNGSAPHQAGLIIEGEGGTYGGRIATRVYSATEAPHFIGYRALGTKSAPTALTSGKGILNISARGYDGGAWSGSANSPGINMNATENWTATAKGSEIVFKTTTNGTNAAAERLIVGSSGDFYPAIDNSVSLGTATYRFNTVYAVNGTINTSDRRLKKDIEASDLGLDFINLLRPVSYKWTSGSDTNEHYGLIAQETEQAIHEIKKAQGDDVDEQNIVVYDKTSDRYGIRYTELFAPMIKAIQELASSLKELANSQNIQTREISELRALIAEIKAENTQIISENKSLKESLQKIQKEKRQNNGRGP